MAKKVRKCSFCGDNATVNHKIVSGKFVPVCSGCKLEAVRGKFGEEFRRWNRNEAFSV